ncbi:N-6 DNA methylase [Pseudonocardia hispaniensis]|uniref:N-6 DNA methylase n=1 Tax=Pseudonocardia hispaniensis TaxID=904933 RepID=A0ABW1IZA6_9PSEU
MAPDTTVNSGDIARLGGVSRAAVSNWRRRYPDFPQPVGGTPSSPRFSLRDVEVWLRRNGRTYTVSAADQVWQRLRAEGGDLGLGHVVARAGALLVWLREGDGSPLVAGVAERTDASFVELVEELAERHGHAGAFELLHGRYLETHGRLLGATSSAVADLMIRLADAPDGSLLDPACGTGGLLLGSTARRVFGQDAAADSAGIAAARLRLHGRTATVRTGDSLRHNALDDIQADAVVCDPPFGDRDWGQPGLIADPRWIHGLPPRGEPELAWVQHCLAHARPGGRVVIRMPAAAASRRAGRRIRANLLRDGALRAVLALGPDADLWLLRRPRPGDPTPSHVLLRDADQSDDVWTEIAAGHGVRIVDLLDDDVDLAPARHVRRSAVGVMGQGYDDALARLRALELAPPELPTLAVRREMRTTPIGRLERAGVVSIRRSAAHMTVDSGELTVLTGEDLALGRPASGRTVPEDRLVRLEPGDVVAAPTGMARVVEAPAVLGPGLAAYRVDPAQLDAEFLAGVLRAAGPWNRSAGRAELRRTRVPRLPLTDQQAYGRAFRALLVLQDTVRAATEQGDRLAHLGLIGLLDGLLGVP